MIVINILEDNIEILKKVYSTINNHDFNEPIRLKVNRTLEEVSPISPGFDDHIYLFDIQIGDKTSIELATKVKEKNPGAILIFMTLYDEFSELSYDLGAIYFLRKPIIPHKLLKVISKAIRKVKSQDRIISLPDQGVQTDVKTNSIKYIEVNNQKTFIYLSDGAVITNSLGLTEAIKRIGDKIIYKISASCGVNKSYIKHIDKNDNIVYLKDGTRVYGSRRGCRELRKILMEDIIMEEMDE